MQADDIYRHQQESTARLTDIDAIRVPGDFYRKASLRDGLMAAMTESNKLSFYKVGDTTAHLASFSMLSVLYDCLMLDETDECILIVISCKKVPVAVDLYRSP